MQVEVAKIIKPHGIRGAVVIESYSDYPEKRFFVGNKLSVQNPENSRNAVDRTDSNSNKKHSPENFSRVSNSIVQKTTYPAQPYYSQKSLTVNTCSHLSGNRYLIKFDEICDRNRAETFRNAILKADELEDSEEDAWYTDELIGLDIFLLSRSEIKSTVAIGEKKGAEDKSIEKKGAEDTSADDKNADDKNADDSFDYSLCKKIGKVSDVIIRPPQDLLVAEINKKENYIPLVEQIVLDVDVKNNRILIDPPGGLFDL